MNAEIKAFIDDYLSEMLAGNAAVFAGAGLSVPAGYVDWRELIRPLSKEIGLNIDWESDLVAIAQFHVNSNGQNRHALHKAIIEAIAADNPPTQNHQLLASLPIQTWWTTNYDKLIETALKDAGKTVDVKSAVAQLATSRKGRDATVFKMHGDIDRPDEAVATRDDFESFHRDRAAFVTALAGDLVSKTFLFLGFSFTDPNLEHILAQVRLTFTKNQRKHYAIFKRRKQRPGEKKGEFDHHRARQLLVIEDMKRYNVKILLVEDYREITEFLEHIFDRYRRRTVFISGSAADFQPWGELAVTEFCQALGQALVASGCRVATGLGVGIGDAVFTGALREVMRAKDRIEDTLVLRPFPQTLGGEAQRKKIWESYRKELISHVGIGLFVFGNKRDAAGDIVDADGMLSEFEMCQEAGVVCLPIGATGSVASKLAADSLANAAEQLAALGAKDLQSLKRLSKANKKLGSLLDPIMQLVATLRGKDLK